VAWDIPGWSQDSRDTKYSRLPWHGTSQKSWDTKYSRIHGLTSHGTFWDGPRNPGVLSIPRLPSHGTSRDGPRNPRILSIPGSTGSPDMGHPARNHDTRISWDKLWDMCDSIKQFSIQPTLHTCNIRVLWKWMSVGGCILNSFYDVIPTFFSTFAVLLSLCLIAFLMSFQFAIYQYVNILLQH